MSNSISSIVESGLCTGCGTCIALCPKDALELTIDKKRGTYVPRIDPKACTACGRCIKVCPGGAIDHDDLNKEIFGETPGTTIGNFCECYVGYSTEFKIRYNASSGGLVSQILIFALEDGLIDGAVVTRMQKDSPTEPEVFIARRREEILEAAGSKYCPVPLNIILKEIIRLNPTEKLAYVGLPCHVHGLRKAQQTNAVLKESIVFCIALMCSHTDNFNSLDFICRSLHTSKEEVTRIEFRGRGWPGSFLICKNDGTTNTISYAEYILSHKMHVFSPTRCLLCCDPIGELADIVCGDAWLIGKNDDVGSSLCIARSVGAHDLLMKARDNNRVVLDPVGESGVIKSQKVLVADKVKLSRLSLFMRKMLGKKCPKYANVNLYADERKPHFADLVKLCVIFFNCKLLSKRFLWRYTPSILKLEERLMKLTIFKKTT